MDVLRELLADPKHEAPASDDILENSLSIICHPHTPHPRGRAFFKEFVERGSFELPTALAGVVDAAADPQALHTDVEHELLRREKELEDREAQVQHQMTVAQEQLRKANDPALVRAVVDAEMKVLLAERDAGHAQQIAILKAQMAPPIKDPKEDPARLKLAVEQCKQKIEELAQHNSVLQVQKDSLETTVKDALKKEPVAAPVRKGTVFEDDFMKWTEENVLTASLLSEIKCVNKSNKPHHTDLHFTHNDKLLMVLDNKDYSKDVNAGQLTKLRNDMENLNTRRGVIVSKSTRVSNGDGKPVDGIKFFGDVIVVGKFIDHVEDTALALQTSLLHALLAAKEEIPDDQILSLEQAAMQSLGRAQDMKRKATENLKCGIQMFDCSNGMIDQIQAEVVKPLTGRAAKRRRSKNETALLAEAKARVASSS